MNETVLTALAVLAFGVLACCLLAAWAIWCFAVAQIQQWIAEKKAR